MDTVIQLAKHLKVSHWQVVRVERWAKVLFAVVRGLGARFVSKKVAKMAISREQATELVKTALEAEESENYQANVWVKNGRVRLYIKDMGYRSQSAQDQGYFAFNSDGTPFYDGLKRNSSVLKFIKKALESLDIAANPEAEQKIQQSKREQKRQPETIQDSWAAYHRDHQPKDWYFGAADEESF